jgi:putative membrane protein
MADIPRWEQEVPDDVLVRRWHDRLGDVLMTLNMVLFWGLVIYGVVVLIRYLTGSARQPTGHPGAPRPTAEQILAERFARGEIEEQDYLRRLTTMQDRSGSTDAPRPS